MNRPTRRPRLFLSSSTVGDLTLFRNEVIHVCQRLEIDVIAMEDFGPNSKPPLAVCKEKVESSDIFVGLYAYRYGTILPEGGNISLTQLEYKWALERKPPIKILPFMVDPSVLWLPNLIDVGSTRDLLDSFKDWLRSEHSCWSLTTPEALRSDLLKYLPDQVREIANHLEQGEVTTGIRQQTMSPLVMAAAPPEPYIAHQYALMQTEKLIGRERELRMLSTWASNHHSRSAILCLIAIGGMGKSAVAWHWFHYSAPEVMDRFSGRIWWSFYEPDAGFDRFISRALAYCGKTQLSAVENLPRGDRESQLLMLLDRENFLLVLDGLERTLMAYAGLDFAHMMEEDLDATTENWSFGPGSSLPGSPIRQASRHRLRRTIDTRDGQFLRKLARIRSSHILVTSRLIPSDLQTETGYTLPGCEVHTVYGLQPQDAIRLWRESQVSGTTNSLVSLFARIDHYPLLIRALAGEVAHYRPAPGDFDAWLAAHPNFDPFAVPLDRTHSHFLAYAMRGLQEDARKVLNMVAAFHSPVNFSTLSALTGASGQLTIEELDRTLTELEDRGLLGWDRNENRYDLHPVIRGVVWSALDDVHRREIFGDLERHFAAMPRPSNQQLRADAVITLLEQFNSLIGLGRHADAADLYIEQIESKQFSFEDAGMQYLNIAALEALFPNGTDRAPVVRPQRSGAITAHLSRAYSAAGRLQDAYEFARLTGERVPQSLKATALDLASRHALALGRIQDAILYSRSSIKNQGHVTAESFATQLAWCEATIGKFADVRRWIAQRRHGPRRQRLAAQIELWLGNYQAAEQLALTSAWSTWDDRVEQLMFHVVLAESRARLGKTAAAISLLTDVLSEARTKSLVELELQTLRCLAEIYYQLGDTDASRNSLDDLADPAARGRFRLIQADAANIEALLADDLDIRLEVAKRAYSLALCDGPTYSYKYAFERAKAMLINVDDMRRRR